MYLCMHLSVNITLVGNCSIKAIAFYYFIKHLCHSLNFLRIYSCLRTGMYVYTYMCICT